MIRLPVSEARILQCAWCLGYIKWRPDIVTDPDPAEHTICCRENYTRLLNEGTVKSLEEFQVLMKKDRER